MATETQSSMNRDQVEMGKLFAEMMNLMADSRRQAVEQEKLHAEMIKMQTETRWHPLFIVAGAFAAGAGFLAAAVAAVAGLIKLFP